MRTYSDTNLAFTITDTMTTGLNYIYAGDASPATGSTGRASRLYFRGQITPSSPSRPATSSSTTRTAS